MIEDTEERPEVVSAMDAMDAVLDYLCQEVGNEKAFHCVIEWVAARRTSDLETRGLL